jgi:serine/threonine protein kinase
MFKRPRDPSGPIPDYYSLLQVNPMASPEVIHAAYLALMKKHHPDANATSGRMARRLNEAYEILSDAAKRRSYDVGRNNLTGKIIGDYRLLKEIAEGGFGTTYLGEHILTEQPVCLKHCHNVDPEFNEILLQETIAMWDLRHFSIPAVRNIIKLEDGRYMLIMSYIPGLTLEQVVNKIGPIPVEHVAWITERVLNALKYIHYHGVIHGDIKPQNIIIQNPTHTISIVDFGLSMVKPSARSDNKGYTALMSPPEQLKGSVLVPESDLYSLGVTMIYALSGDIQAVKHRSVPNYVPDELCSFIRRLIVRDVNSRPKWGMGGKDLCDEIKEVRLKCFGKGSTSLAPIPGLD